MNPQQSGMNPYASVNNPGTYAGSGYHADPMQSAQPGYPPPGATGMASQAAGAPTEDFKQYTEANAMATTHTPSGDKIDPETGMGPQRMSDCVVIPIFFGYMLAMIVLVCHAMHSAVPQRLTHGYDYFGRLCGVDDEVATKPYLYFCRSDGTNVSNATIPPSGQEPLNLGEPLCVSTCPDPPNAQKEQLKCLAKEQYLRQGQSGTFAWAPIPKLLRTGANGANGMFGVTASNYVKLQQSKMATSPYPTKLFFGRYCMPKDQGLRALIMNSFTGPVNAGVRWTKSVGSFRNTWWVMFAVTCISIVVAFATVFLLRTATRYLLWFVLALCGIFCSVAALYFLTAIFTLIPNFPEQVLWFNLESWKDSNPIYGRFLQTEATIVNIFFGLVFVCLAVGFFYKMTRVQERMFMIHELLQCSYRAMFQMKSVWIWPVIESFLKLIITVWVWNNFVYLITKGSIDDRRIIVNEIQIQGASKKYYFDWWMLPWILFYGFGSLWALEFISSLGQFIDMFAICSWYYTPRRENPAGGYEKEKDLSDLGPFQWLALAHGLKIAIRYHFGSIAYGASFMWYYRLPRILDYLFFDFVKTDANGKETPVCGCCGLHKYVEDNCGDWHKIVYCDVIYRSTHWDQAKQRAQKTKKSHAQVLAYMHTGMLPTFVGVIWTATVGAGIAWAMFTQIGCFTDVSSSWYIQDPIACTILAWFIAGNVGFGFFKVVEDGMDGMLYFYGQNKKHNKKSCNKYMPDELTAVVGNEHNNPDSYPYYGKNVPTTMYFTPYMSALRGGDAGKKTEKKPASTARDLAPASGGESPPPQGSMYGGNQPTNYQQAYQSQTPYPGGPV